MLKKIDRKIVKSRAIHLSSQGNEALVLVFFTIIVILAGLLVISIYSEQSDKRLSSYIKSLKKSAVNTTIAKEDENTKPDNPRVIKVDDSILVKIKLNNDKYTEVKLPRASYYFKSAGITKRDGLYQYLIALSKVLSNMANDPNIDSSSLEILAYSISDKANAGYALNNYNTQDLPDSLVDDDNYSQKIFAYLDSLNITLSQLKDENYSVSNYFNEVTKLNQVNYARNLSQALKEVSEEEYLHDEVKLFVKLVASQVIAISENYVLMMPAEIFSDSKKILRKLIHFSTIEINTKKALLSALNAPLTDKGNTNTFITIVLTVLKSDNTLLNRLDFNEKLFFLKAVSSIEVTFDCPYEEIIDYNLASRFNCLKQNGVYNDGVCTVH